MPRRQCLCSSPTEPGACCPRVGRWYGRHAGPGGGAAQPTGRARGVINKVSGTARARQRPARVRRQRSRARAGPRVHVYSRVRSGAPRARAALTRSPAAGRPGGLPAGGGAPGPRRWADGQRDGVLRAAPRRCTALRRSPPWRGSLLPTRARRRLRRRLRRRPPPRAPAPCLANAHRAPRRLPPRRRRRPGRRRALRRRVHAGRCSRWSR